MLVAYHLLNLFFFTSILSSLLGGVFSIRYLTFLFHVVHDVQLWCLSGSISGYSLRSVNLSIQDFRYDLLNKIDFLSRSFLMLLEAWQCNDTEAINPTITIKLLSKDKARGSQMSQITRSAATTTTSKSTRKIQYTNLLQRCSNSLTNWVQLLP